MMFRPLAFDYPEDKMAIRVEDQLLVGDSIMIAPVYVQNAEGRNVYLPEKMKKNLTKIVLCQEETEGKVTDIRIL